MWKRYFDDYQDRIIRMACSYCKSNEQKHAGR